MLATADKNRGNRLNDASNTTRFLRKPTSIFGSTKGHSALYREDAIAKLGLSNSKKRFSNSNRKAIRKRMLELSQREGQRRYIEYRQRLAELRRKESLSAETQLSKKERWESNGSNQQKESLEDSFRKREVASVAHDLKKELKDMDLTDGQIYGIMKSFPTEHENIHDVKRLRYIFLNANPDPFDRDEALSIIACAQAEGRINYHKVLEKKVSW